MSDKPAPKKRLERRRRENVPGGRKHSHVVRVSHAEEAQLVRLAAAQRVTVPRLLIESALAGTETPTDRRRAMAELFALRRQLSGIATNINQLARAANTDGRLAVGTTAAIEEIAPRIATIDKAIDRLAAS